MANVGDNFYLIILFYHWDESPSFRPASVDAGSDIAEAEIPLHQSRTSASRSPHFDGGASSSSSSSSNNATNNQQHLRAGVPHAHGGGGRAVSSSGGSATGEGMMILDFLDDFDSNARAHRHEHAYVSEIGDDEEEGECENEGVDEMGALPPHAQGSRGSGSGNVTMVAGEKRKRRAV
jgi:hypothetical protein